MIIFYSVHTFFNVLGRDFVVVKKCFFPRRAGVQCSDRPKSGCTPKIIEKCVEKLQLA